MDEKLHPGLSAGLNGPARRGATGSTSVNGVARTLRVLASETTRGCFDHIVSADAGTWKASHWNTARRNTRDKSCVDSRTSPSGKVQR